MYASPLYIILLRTRARTAQTSFFPVWSRKIATYYVTYVCTARTTRAGIRREEHVAWRRTGRARLRRIRNNVTRMATYPQKASRPLILQFNSSTKNSYKYVSIIFTHQLVSFLASSFSAIHVNLINLLIKQFVELSLILFTSSLKQM